MEVSELEDQLEELIGEQILMILKPAQLNILGQAFKPIFCAEVAEVEEDYVELRSVNIKMQNAPEFMFPTPLIIPLEKIALMFPFDCDTRFPLV